MKTETKTREKIHDVITIGICINIVFIAVAYVFLEWRP